jgi:hypothetical protein
MCLPSSQSPTATTMHSNVKMRRVRGQFLARLVRLHSPVLFPPSSPPPSLQQGQPTLPGRQVRDQQRAVGRRDHRRNDRHQPTAEGRIWADVAHDDHQVWIQQAVTSPQRCPADPQHPVGIDRRTGPIRSRPSSNVPRCRPSSAPSAGQSRTAHHGAGGIPPRPAVVANPVKSDREIFEAASLATRIECSAWA